MVERFSEEELAALAEVLERTFPDLRPVGPLQFIGRGFRSLAVETAGGVLMRVGESADAAAGYELEMRVLPFIRRHVDALVPQPRWYASPGGELPHGALGYPILPGRNPQWGVEPPESLAQDVGRFMAQLHSAPVDEAKSFGIQDVDSLARLFGAEDVVMPVLKVRLTAHHFGRVEQWWQELHGDERMRRYEARVCHHDLWHGNLLVDGAERLSGVLDWAHVEIGDPAHDFGAVRYFGERFVGRLLDAYQADRGRFGPEEQHRAQRYWEGREFGGIAWAIEHGDDVELEEGIRKLGNGPLIGV